MDFHKKNGPPDKFYRTFNKWGLVDMTGATIDQKRRLFPRGKERKYPTNPNEPSYDILLEHWLKKIPEREGMVPHVFKKELRQGNVTQWCNHCGDFVWLLQDRAFKCIHCELHAHANCAVEQKNPQWPICTGSKEMRILLEKEMVSLGLSLRKEVYSCWKSLKQKIEEAKLKGEIYDPPPPKKYYTPTEPFRADDPDAEESGFIPKYK